MARSEDLANHGDVVRYTSNGKLYLLARCCDRSGEEITVAVNLETGGFRDLYGRAARMSSPGWYACDFRLPPEWELVPKAHPKVPRYLEEVGAAG